jgi:RNA polymerase sigma-70 factor, ECF subfamily
LDEAQAIAQLKRGDINGLEFLVRRHQLRAVRAAYLITQDRWLAEDIVQTAFLRVYERIHQFDSSRPFAPWFLRIVVNDATKAVTRKAHPISLSATDGAVDSDLAELIADASVGPEQSIEAAEFEQAVQQALEKLNPEQRAAVVLRYYLDFSEHEMVCALGSPAGTIKWRLHTARQQLRRLLFPWSVTAHKVQEKKL